MFVSFFNNSGLFVFVLLCLSLFANLEAQELKIKEASNLDFILHENDSSLDPVACNFDVNQDGLFDLTDVQAFREYILLQNTTYTPINFFEEYNSANPNNQLDNPGHLDNNKLSSYDLYILEFFILGGDQSDPYDISVFNGLNGSLYCDCVLGVPPGTSAYCEDIVAGIDNENGFVFDPTIIDDENEQGTNQPSGNLSCEYSLVLTPIEGDPVIFPLPQATWNTSPNYNPDLINFAFSVEGIDFQGLTLGDFIHEDFHDQLYFTGIGPIVDWEINHYIGVSINYNPLTDEIDYFDFIFGLGNSGYPFYIYDQEAPDQIEEGSYALSSFFHPDANIQITQECP